MKVKDILKASDLAVCGAPPVYTEALHVGAPNLGDRADFHKRVDDIFDSRWLTNNGLQVQEFEKTLAAYLGVKHVIACCNATVGLMLAIRSLNLTGEVLVPSYTFVATAHSLAWQGITPVFCDINPETLTIDPEEIKRRITPKTTGILGVHLWGRACDIDAIQSIADEYDLKVIYDAAHAFGCTYKNKLIGGFGDAEVFSFHATKFLNTAEGGAIATNSDETAHILRQKINFGFKEYDTVDGIGINGKMSELSAALGLTNFSCLKNLLDHNHFIFECYQKAFEKIQGIELLQNNRELTNNQYVVIRIHETLELTREQLHEILRRENIMVRRYFYPGCHRMPCYNASNQSTETLLHSDSLADSVLCLPTGTAIGPKEVEIIKTIISIALKKSKKIKEVLHD